jgi:tetratricopeptide (TPR) repeat protein
MHRLAISIEISLVLVLPFASQGALCASKEAELDVKEGLAIAKRNHLSKAIPFFDQAIKLDPNYTNAYLARAGTLLELEEDERALSDLNQVIKLDPSIFQAYSKRARVYFELQRFKEALSDSSKLVQLAKTPEDKSYALRMRGKLYVQTQQPSLALADYSAAMLVDPKNQYNRSERAAIYESNGQYQKAIEDYTAAIKLCGPIDRHRLNYYSSRGRLYEKIGRKDLAAADHKIVEQSVKDFEDN